MIARIAALCLLAYPAAAQDTAYCGESLAALRPGTGEAVEDLGPLPRRWTDEQAYAHLDEDVPLPMPVPLPAGLWLLAGALIALRVIK
jgi:hypothetical protein